jgi:hypothetical protein
MGMDVPPEVRTLFLVLTGEEWPQVDEDGLLVLGHAWGKAATRLRNDLEPQLTSSVRSIRSSFFGAAEQGFADMMAPYSVEEPRYIESAAEQFDSADRFLADTSVQVQYVKLISILSLVELLVEIVWALAVAPFFPSALTWLAARMKIVSFLLDRLWGRLLIRIVTAEVMGMAFQVAMDAMVQAIQLANGSRGHWDSKLTVQALEVGALGGALGVPFQAIGEKLGRLLGDGLVRAFGKDAGKLAGAARKAVDDHLDDLGTAPIRDVAEKIAIGIDKHAGESVRDNFLRHTGTHLVDTVQEGLHEAFTEGLYGAMTGQGFNFNPFSFTSGAFSGQTSLAHRGKSRFATDLEATWQDQIEAGRAPSRPGGSTVDDTPEHAAAAAPAPNLPVATGPAAPSEPATPPPTTATAATPQQTGSPSGQPAARQSTTERPLRQAGSPSGQPVIGPSTAEALPRQADRPSGQPVTGPSTTEPPRQQAAARQQPPGQSTTQPPPVRQAQPPGQPSVIRPAPSQAAPDQSAEPPRASTSAPPAEQRTNLAAPRQPAPPQRPAGQPPGQPATAQAGSQRSSTSLSTPSQPAAQSAPLQPAAGQSAPGQSVSGQPGAGPRAQSATQGAPVRRAEAQPAAVQRPDVGQTTAQASTTPPPARSDGTGTPPAAATVAVPTAPRQAPPVGRRTPAPGRPLDAPTPAPGRPPRAAPSTSDRPGVFVADRGNRQLLDVAAGVAVPPGYFAVVLHAAGGEPAHADRAAVLADIGTGYRDWVAANGPAAGIVLLGCGLGAGPHPFAADLAAALPAGDTVLASADDVFVDPHSGQVSTGRPTVTGDGRIGWQPGEFAAFTAGSRTGAGWTPTGTPDLGTAVRLASTQPATLPIGNPPALPAPAAPANPAQHRTALRDYAANWRTNSATNSRRGRISTLDDLVRAWHDGSARLPGNLAANRQDLQAIQTAITTWRAQARAANGRRAAVATLGQLVRSALTEIGQAEVEAARRAQVTRQFREISPALAQHARRTDMDVIENSAAHQAYLAARTAGQLDPTSLAALDTQSQLRVADQLNTTVGITVEPGVTAADIQRAITAGTNPITGRTTHPELETYLANAGPGPLTTVTGPAGTFATQQQTHTVGGTAVTVHTDPTDPGAPQRVAALLTAVNRVAAAGFTVPPITAHLPKYGRSLAVTANGVQGRGRGLPRAEYIAPASIVLSPEGRDNPIPVRIGAEFRFLSTTLDPTGIGTMVHELGHFLHHANDRAKFWDLNFAGWSGPAEATSLTVSDYAHDNPREFVAETFLGLVYGRRFPADVLALYAQLGGALPAPQPRPDGFVVDLGDQRLVAAAQAARVPAGYFAVALHGSGGEAVLNGSPADRAAVIDRIVTEYRGWAAANPRARGIALLGCGLGATPGTPGTAAFAADLAARIGPLATVLASTADVFVDPDSGEIHSGQIQVDPGGTVTWTRRPFTRFHGGPGAVSRTHAFDLVTNKARPGTGAVRLAAPYATVPPLTTNTGPTGSARDALAELGRQWAADSARAWPGRSGRLREIDRTLRTWLDDGNRYRGEIDRNLAQLRALRDAIRDWGRDAARDNPRRGAVDDLAAAVDAALAEYAPLAAAASAQEQLQERARRLAPGLERYLRRTIPTVDPAAALHQPFLADRTGGDHLEDAPVRALDRADNATLQRNLATTIAIDLAPGTTIADIDGVLTGSRNELTGQTGHPELTALRAHVQAGGALPVTGTPAGFAGTATRLSSGGSSVIVMSDPADPLGAQRQAVVDAALARIHGRGLTVTGLTIHLPRFGRGLTVRTDGVLPAPGGIRRAEYLAPGSIAVGPDAHLNPMTRLDADGRQHYLSATLDPAGPATMIHEMGHHLHRQQNPRIYWDLFATTFTEAGLRIARQVSGYAARPREFVAEVFLGLMYDVRWPAEVLAMYDAMGGPRPPVPYGVWRPRLRDARVYSVRDRGGRIGFDVAEVTTPAGRVRAHRVRLFTAAPGTGASGLPVPAAVADRNAFAARVRAGLAAHLNDGRRLPGGQQFHLDVEFVSDPAQAHGVVEVAPGVGETTQFGWYGNAAAMELAAQVLRFLGVDDADLSAGLQPGDLRLIDTVLRAWAAPEDRD